MSHITQIDKLINSMHTKIDVIWVNIADINNKLKIDTKKFKDIRKLSANLRKLHLTERVSALNIKNKSSSAQIVINIQKIEQVIKMWKTIKMWKKINYVLVSKQQESFKTIDVPADKTIKWNDIKKHKDLQFKIINDEEIMGKNSRSKLISS